MSHGNAEAHRSNELEGLKSDIPSSEDGTPGSALISLLPFSTAVDLLRDQVLTWLIHIEVVGIYNWWWVWLIATFHIATKLYNCERHGSHAQHTLTTYARHLFSENYPPESIFHIAPGGQMPSGGSGPLSFTQIPVVLTSHVLLPSNFIFQLGIVYINQKLK